MGKNDIKLNESQCQCCGGKIDTYTKVSEEDTGPTPGTVVICSHCGHISKYDEKLELIAITDKELNDIRLYAPAAYKFLMTARAVIKQQIQKN